jgi:hypothetical protein
MTERLQSELIYILGYYPPGLREGRHSSSTFSSTADSLMADCLLYNIYLFTSIVCEKT